MVVMATVITACGNCQAEAPPPPPPEVDAAQVVTKSVRQWDEFTGRIAAIGAVDIRPRVSGYIDRIAFKEGDMVKAGDLLFVVDPRPYRATYDNAGAQRQRANSDNPVRVGLASETGFPHSGTMNFVNNQVDAATGTINVRATVPNPDGVFVPGLYARVQLEGRAEYMAMLIDDKAIMTDQDRKYVYVLGPEDKAKRKDIVLGSVHDGLRVVQSGLDANDKVIVAGLQKIFAADTKVKPNLVAMSARPQS